MPSGHEDILDLVHTAQHLIIDSPSSTTPMGFTLFPELPAELRILTWEHLLPTLGPAVYVYRQDCWGARLVLDNDPHFSVPAANRGQRNCLVTFYPERLGVARVGSVLLAVNREARHIASTWVANHASPTLRSFDATQDVVCFNPDDWDEHFTDHLRAMGMEWDELFLSPVGGVLTRLAVPERYFAESDKKDQRIDLNNLLLTFPRVETLFVICGDLFGMPVPPGGVDNTGSHT